MQNKVKEYKLPPKAFLIIVPSILPPNVCERSLVIKKVTIT
jgi:hypothetical protein